MSSSRWFGPHPSRILCWSALALMLLGACSQPAPGAQLQQSAVAPAATPPPAPTLAPAEAMLGPRERAEQAFQDEAWPQAALLYRELYRGSAAVADAERLGTIYYRLALHELGSQNVLLALERLNTALAFAPRKRDALDAQWLVAGYLDGLADLERQAWPEAIARFEELRQREDFQTLAQAGAFGDLPGQLYIAYVKQGNSLEQEQPPRNEAALAIYRQAAQLPVEDRSAAEARIAALSDTDLQPSPTPEAGPTARPTTRPSGVTYIGTLYDNPNDGAVQCGTQFASSIWGIVKGRTGNGIAGATITVTTSDGRTSYMRTTDVGGRFNFDGGLGCTTWTVRLTGVPGQQLARTPAINVYVNGGALSGGGVVFQQR